MIAFDTNVLLYALNADCPEHGAARAFLDECAQRDDVVVAELVLVELYTLLRNPAVVTSPLPAQAAAAACQAFRRHPRWALVENAPVMDEVWDFAARPRVARRRIFDARLALTLRYHGVGDLATDNVRHFQDFGFDRVFSPIDR
jgi:toxin-antitoxin system PIN domain toxin